MRYEPRSKSRKYCRPSCSPRMGRTPCSSIRERIFRPRIVLRSAVDPGTLDIGSILAVHRGLDEAPQGRVVHSGPEVEEAAVGQQDAGVTLEVRPDGRRQRQEHGCQDERRPNPALAPCAMEPQGRQEYGNEWEEQTLGEQCEPQKDSGQQQPDRAGPATGTPSPVDATSRALRCPSSEPGSGKPPGRAVGG